MAREFKLYGPDLTNGYYDYFTGEPVGEDVPSQQQAGGTRPWSGGGGGPGYNPGPFQPSPPAPVQENKFVLRVVDFWEGDGAKDYADYSRRLAQYFKMLNWVTDTENDRGYLNPNIVGPIQTFRTTRFPDVPEVGGKALGLDMQNSFGRESKF